MTADEAKVGQVVKLKSGGPLMTVYMVNDRKEVVCHWFQADEKFQVGRFEPAMLIVVPVDGQYPKVQ